MAKFKSVVAGNGSRVWVPLTREGWLEPITDDAVNAGMLKHEDGKPYTLAELNVEREAIQKDLRVKEIAALKKRREY